MSASARRDAISCWSSATDAAGAGPVRRFHRASPREDVGEPFVGADSAEVEPAAAGLGLGADVAVGVDPDDSALGAVLGEPDNDRGHCRRPGSDTMNAMVTFFDTRQLAEAGVPRAEGLSPTAAAVFAALAAVFGPDVAGTLSPVNQPLPTVGPRTAMYAVIDGLRCTVYADYKAINVLTPACNAESYLRAHARFGDAIVQSPGPGGNPVYAGVRYALADVLDLVPEVADAQVLADEAAGRSPRRAMLSTALERKLIEERAIRVATEHLEALGYRVDDVGAYESYDLACHRDEERLYVEVKGTTSHGEAVILTKNEVELHRAAHPANALAIVRRIGLDRSVEPLEAFGGELVLTMPWKIDDEALTPLSYQYSTGLGVQPRR